MSSPISHTPSHPLTQGDPRLRTAGRVIRALEFLSARAAATLADAVFCRTTRRPLRQEELTFLSEAVAEPLEVGTHRIATYRWTGTPPDAGVTVLLAHGWGSQAARFAPMARALLARGAVVVAFDAPGHGASTGWRASMPEFAAALRAVADARGPIDVVIGHSLGGAAALFAAGRGMHVERIVTVATPAAIGVWLDHLRDALRLSPRVDALLRARLMRRLHVTEAEINLPQLAPSLVQRGLVVHDVDDPDVPISEAEQLVAAWPHATLKRTNGLGHRAILRDPTVIRAAVDFALQNQNGL